MDDHIQNHYQVLNLPVSATRHQIREAYNQCMQELESTPRPTVGVGLPCQRNVQCSAVIAKSDSLRVIVPEDILKTWRGIDRIIVTSTALHVAKPPDAPNSNDIQFKRLPTSQFIIRRNELSDAHYILSHPVKKKAFDLEHNEELCKYEHNRINEHVHGSVDQDVARVEVKRWRTSLTEGSSSAKPWTAERFNRVQAALDTFSAQEKSVTAVSRMCGEVIAGFVDSMEF